jgi:hypothetical protein
MNLRTERALDAGTLVTDFNTSSFSIVQSLAKFWNKFKVVESSLCTRECGLLSQHSCIYRKPPQ